MLLWPIGTICPDRPRGQALEPFLIVIIVAGVFHITTHQPTINLFDADIHPAEAEGEGFVGDAGVTAGGHGGSPLCRSGKADDGCRQVPICCLLS